MELELGVVSAEWFVWFLEGRASWEFFLLSLLFIEFGFRNIKILHLLDLTWVILLEGIEGSFIKEANDILMGTF